MNEKFYKSGIRIFKLGKLSVWIYSDWITYYTPPNQLHSNHGLSLGWLYIEWGV